MAEVLLVDAGFSAVPLYRRLRAMGLNVHTVGARAEDALARMNSRHWLLDYSDTEALARRVDAAGIDYLVPGCTDVSYASCVALNRDGRFPGVETAANIDRLHDKKAFRQMGRELGLSMPKVLDETQPAHFPVIVKPVDAFSGQGITVVEAGEDFEPACQRARGLSRSGRIVVEEFVRGQLHSHSVFLSQQRVVADFLVEEHCVAEPWKVDLSHAHALISDALRARLRAEVEILAGALGLCDGLLHLQFICDNERFWWIEPARRCPGDLYSQLIELSYGPGYVDGYLAGFLGSAPAADTVKPPLPVLRHTLSCPAGEAFEGLECRPPAPLRRFVPLMEPGQAAGEQPRRAGIGFYEFESHEVLMQTVAQARQGQGLATAPVDSHEDPNPA